MENNELVQDYSKLECGSQTYVISDGDKPVIYFTKHKINSGVISYITSDLSVQAKPISANSLLNYIKKLPLANTYAIEKIDHNILQNVKQGRTIVLHSRHIDVVPAIMELINKLKHVLIEITSDTCISEYKSVIYKQHDQIYVKVDDVTTVMKMSELHEYLASLVKLTGMYRYDYVRYTGSDKPYRISNGKIVTNTKKDNDL